LTFYNDKSLKKQDTQYKQDIKDWEKKLADIEDRYYKQFTAMEKALSKLQNQQNSLASMMGMGTG
jgi:flagellar hook-associated protein 2